MLKEKFPATKVFAVEPAASPVISGGAPGPHPIQVTREPKRERGRNRQGLRAPFLGCSLCGPHHKETDAVCWYVVCAFVQGIGAGFIPQNLHKHLLDGVITVSKEEAFEYSLRAAKEEGMFGVGT